jgi:cell division protein FtsZ
MDLGIFEVNEAADLVFQSADPDANIIFGAVIDESMKDEIRITVIATGFDENKPFILPGDKEQEEQEGEKKPEAPKSGYRDDDLDIPTFLRNKLK